jgi:hypothetical protein
MYIAYSTFISYYDIHHASRTLDHSPTPISNPADNQEGHPPTSQTHVGLIQEALRRHHQIAIQASNLDADISTIRDGCKILLIPRNAGTLWLSLVPPQSLRSGIAYPLPEPTESDTRDLLRCLQELAESIPDLNLTRREAHFRLFEGQPGL